MTVTILHEKPALSSVRFTSECTRIASDPPSSNAETTGTLYVDERQLVFYSEQPKAGGFSVDYQSIVIHAISRDSGDDAHLYCQLDGPFPGSKRAIGQDGENSDDEEQDGDEIFCELRFFPKDSSILDSLFDAMSECAALNPDTQSGNEGDDGDDGDDAYVGQFHDGVPDSITADDNTVTAIDEFDPSDFFTSADQADKLTPE
ncbi:hypothetical protein GGI12_005991, partial [Dipsacomyces acuminosporus]